MDLPRALVEEEKTTGDQDHVPPGNGVAEQLEQRLGEADDPGDRGEQREAGEQRQCQSDLPGPVLSFRRQPAGEDRDKDQVVDTEHDLEGGQRQKARPDLRIDYPIHSDAHPWLPALRSGLPVRRRASGLRYLPAGFGSGSVELAAQFRLGNGDAPLVEVGRAPC